MEENKKENLEPMAAWFLGPKAEHANAWSETINYIFQDYIHWRRNYFPEDPVIVDRHKRREHEIWFDKLNTEIDKILNQLKAHYPFYSPRYIAHMLSEQTLPSVVGYFAGMLYNPNNVTDEAAPITVELEIEVGKMICDMIGYDSQKSWSHLCSGGTIANIESLWVMRTTQMIPLMIKEFCLIEKIDFKIKQPNGKLENIIKIPDLNLLKLIPNESLFMPRKLAKYLIQNLKQSDKIIDKINNHIQNSKFNISKRGFHEVLKHVDFKPVILISEAAHYCMKKAANILGFGENCIRLIPVNSQFRMNTSKLKEVLWNLRDDEVVISVIGIVGSTEEGAIDPIHEIVEIRKEYQKAKNSSFWFHIDAAWGGYLRSILNGTKVDLNKGNFGIEFLHQNFMKEVDLVESVRIKRAISPKDKIQYKDYIIDWGNIDLFNSLLSMKDADSVTIDPHKLGYVPYPAGVISYKNGLVTEMIVQKAQYISDEEGGMKDIDKPLNITAVGPYIMEGSKPGAAAASCWLAHKTIPLNYKGHGKIIKTTLLNSQKLYLYLTQHKKQFRLFEEEIFGAGEFDSSQDCFSLEPLYQPDCNLVCFIIEPMSWSNGKMVKKDWSLKQINELNKRVYDQLTIKNIGKTHKMPYMQEYFVSRTTLDKGQYAYNSLKSLMTKFGISRKEYNKYGMFVLRSTVMNPWHYMAAKQGKDYLLDYVKNLHKCSRIAIDELNNKRNPRTIM